MKLIVFTTKHLKALSHFEPDPITDEIGQLVFEGENEMENLIFRLNQLENSYNKLTATYSQVVADYESPLVILIEKTKDISKSFEADYLPA